MILGIGVDVCHIPRIARVAVNPRFPARILSPPEHERFALLNANERVRFLAVRWAIKESAYKALYPLHKPGWKDLVFLATESKKPVLTFHKHKEIKLHASVSHDGEYVFATILAESATILSPTFCPPRPPRRSNDPVLVHPISVLGSSGHPFTLAPLFAPGSSRSRRADLFGHGRSC
ncbi:unnamed protein product [Rhizoctonia solani]|uniref:4'-phosphopantetheinyl transferase domain-containing protein n=1 Tax=Rhizoctonia solani TaxID=456999 RepID=A0A8H3DFF9_9AGAM|nr:unnamed protein product [Rhizoctonia solani]